jgi:hypothetical protein
LISLFFVQIKISFNRIKNKIDATSVAERQSEVDMANTNIKSLVNFDAKFLKFSMRTAQIGLIDIAKCDGSLKTPGTLPSNKRPTSPGEIKS